MDVEVRKSKIHGRGVFATHYFSPSDVILKTPALLVPRTEILKSHALFPHTFGWTETHWIVPLGAAAFLNNHPKYNATIVYNTEHQEIWVHAIRHIYEDDEVLICYAADHESGKMLGDKSTNSAAD